MGLHRTVSFGWLVLIVSGCTLGDQPDEPADGIDEAPVIEDREEGKSLLDEIRAQVKPNGAGSASAVLVAALGKREGVAFQRRGSSIEATFSGAELGPLSAKVALPGSADGAFELSSLDSSLRVAASLRGARAVPAQVAEGLVLYPDAGPDGQTIFHRVSPQGTEDYLTLEAPPASGGIVYEVELSGDVSGLRLVENTLEFLDGASVPRLRVAAPYLVDARGEEHAAQLEVEGCAVDRAPAAPWDRAPTPPGAAACDVVIRWDGEDIAYPAVLDPAWTSTASLASARARHAAAVLSTGRVLVAGGSSASGAALQSAELYDPATGTWSATASMAFARVQHTATVRANGTVAVVGGWNFTAVHQNAEAYNPGTGTWSSLPAPSVGRRQHTATLLQNGELLIAGGRSSAGELASAETLSTTNTWSATGNLLAAQAAHTATLLGDGRALLVGLNAPTAQIYEPVARTFSATAGSAEPRKEHTATLLSDGSVLVAGGTNAAGEILKRTERYDPGANQWSRVGALNHDHAEHTAHRLPDGRVLVVGGPTSDVRTAVEIYNPTWGTWAPAGPGSRALAPRSAHAAAFVNGKVLVAGGLPSGASAPTASAEVYDPSGGGVTVAEYKLPAYRDAEVNPDADVELWASLHRPSTLTPGTRYPLLVFLHGNHATCGTATNPRFDNNSSYSLTGACPAGYIVVQNHRGYDYMAEELAARGFFVVSINTNRGINALSGPAHDPFLILSRGRLVLRHLEKLSRWDSGVEATPASLGVSLNGRVDFSEVGLLGHSRGGEGVRLAYAEYRGAGGPWPGRIGPVNIRGIFEIGPVDRRIPGVELNAQETRWNVLLPACDRDIVDLEGVKVFDRMIQMPESTPQFKSTYHVWGANHNFYNTEWQVDDTPPVGCVNHTPLFVPLSRGSAEQRQTGLFSALSFFTANVGTARDAAANALFDPRFPLSLGYRVHRGYHPGGDESYSMVLEDFDNPTGTSSHGLPNEQSASVSLVHTTSSPHDPSLSIALIQWEDPGASTYFQSNWRPIGSGIDLTSYESLDLRVDRVSALSSPSLGSFLVELVNADNTRSSPVTIDEYVDLLPPARAMSVYQTARIPLSEFAGANLAAVRAVRLVFTTEMLSPIEVANIRATRTPESFAALQSLAAAPMPAITSPGSASARSAAAAGPRRVTQGNVVQSVKRRGADAVEITLSSPVFFEPRALILVLTAGQERSIESEHPGGDLYTVRFVLSRDVWDRLGARERLTVSYGEGSPVEWDFGALDKAALK
ncbi:uncharacterized protein SOCE26_081140 [Sorangium cellulosum]|uniref:Uncharacterized protein n=1 Tax=Sorangium cellulosum TaxID=56 RepID=A0A2L0F4T5_SORCE|nr:kelch repeat-containing protein [Sorangium cellulosum]AUX46608.1 uncharacterized protein SOCE26_081140 [Sorangium cellulosum]